MISVRDFVMGFHFNMDEVGNIRIIGFSVPADDILPCEKGIVRAWVNIGGWKLEALDENRTKCTYLSELDLKGSLPGFVVSKGNKDQGY